MLTAALSGKDFDCTANNGRKVREEAQVGREGRYKPGKTSLHEKGGSMVYQKKPVWVNPDWSKAKVYTAAGAMQCFGLGCPRGVIQAGAIYTLHRVKASGYYADRAFCADCHPVRQMPAGFDPRTAWRETMYQHDKDWIREKQPRETC
jgi:hypothetical protein